MPSDDDEEPAMPSGGGGVGRVCVAVLGEFDRERDSAAPPPVAVEIPREPALPTAAAAGGLPALAAAAEEAADTSVGCGRAGSRRQVRQNCCSASDSSGLRCTEAIRSRQSLAEATFCHTVTVSEQIPW